MRDCPASIQFYKYEMPARAYCHGSGRPLSRCSALRIGRWSAASKLETARGGNYARIRRRRLQTKDLEFKPRSNSVSLFPPIWPVGSVLPDPGPGARGGLYISRRATMSAAFCLRTYPVIKSLLVEWRILNEWLVL